MQAKCSLYNDIRLSSVRIPTRPFVNFKAISTESANRRARSSSVLADMMPQIDKPIILAGGLNPENVGEAIATVHPFCVDVSSAVESTPGVKDPQLIREFCDAVARADAIV